MKPKKELIKFRLDFSTTLFLNNNKNVKSFNNVMTCKIPRPFCDGCCFNKLCTEVASEIDKAIKRVKIVLKKGNKK